MGFLLHVMRRLRVVNPKLWCEKNACIAKKDTDRWIERTPLFLDGLRGYEENLT